MSKKGKNTNYLNEYKYIRGVFHNLNLECLRPHSDTYQINLIAKDFVKRMLSNYIYFDKWTIDIDELVNELFNISDRYHSLKNRQLIWQLMDAKNNNNINQGA